MLGSRTETLPSSVAKTGEVYVVLAVVLAETTSI
jgi:hypothetical protein